jgi:hypothetical protein
MFGNALVDITVASLAGIWILGWILLLSIMIAEKLVPSKTEKLELLLKNTGRILGPVQKYLFVFLVVLFALKLITGWLGWAEPLG